MLEKSDAGKTLILLVEDNPADVGLFRLALKDAELDCDLTVLEDGAAALSLIRHSDTGAGARIPDLAVLDLNLPKNGGLEVLEAIRANSAFANMRVAILSSSSSPRERARIEEFGVDRFITKPLDLDGFLGIGSVLKDLLREGSGQSASAL
uniref:Response regulator receiver protein n=1 Tax=Solibacter usitatus (strain Ellin6076) TaxID=234267 RepID=Q028L4_SOLUE